MPSGIATHPWRRASHTETVGDGNLGSAKAPTGTAIVVGLHSRRAVALRGER